jgi:transcriptional regulator with XRE-family HTH domain
MIQNERQYKITKARADEFERKLKALPATPPSDIHPLIAQAQRDAIKSQLDELREEIEAYDQLRQGRSKVLELTSLDALPAALIQARIAAGLTQRELAERLGLKEQQLQRYEATQYSGASLSRVREVVAALGVSVREDVFLPGANVSVARVLKRAEAGGVSKDLVNKRIVPRRDEEGTSDEAAALTTAARLNRIFGWAPAALFGDAPLAPGGPAIAGARFKMPLGASARFTQGYAAYAHYVAGLLLRATPSLCQHPVPIDPSVVRTAVEALGDGVVSLEATLDYVWSLGIAVLPLADPGAFHAATWRISGRNVIVLKQGTRQESRWLNDVLHELRHCAEEPEATDLAFIDYETLAKENLASAAETTASMFAGDVMLAGRAEELAKQCADEAGGSIERLKGVVPRVAKREGVSVAALANYMAFRLALQGASWWGAATNLQGGSVNPWEVTRNKTLSCLDLAGLDDAERSVLLRALEGDAP